jgi:hypothetical protein
MWRLMKEESINIRNAERLLHMEVVTVNFDHFYYIGYDWRKILCFECQIKINAGYILLSSSFREFSLVYPVVRILRVKQSNTQAEMLVIRIIAYAFEFD